MIPVRVFLERIRRNEDARFRPHTGMAMYAPVHFTPKANRLLNEAFGDQGDNLSVPLGRFRSDEMKPLYFGGNYMSATTEHVVRAVERLSTVPHTTVLLAAPGLGASPSQVLAIVRGNQVFYEDGRMESFGSFAREELGVEVLNEATAPSEIPDFNYLISGILYPTNGARLLGNEVKLIGIAWEAVLEELHQDPNLFYKFCKFPRRFEEFIATSYEKSGFHVTLTPQSGDGGVDIIAEKRGAGAVRILDQTKAFAPNHRVSANDVRALMGTLSMYPNASKAVMTTTSDFAPRVRKEFEPYTPYRLELRDGRTLLDWLSQLRELK